MKKKIFYFLLVLFNQAACTQFIDLNDDTIEPILVLNSIITPDSIIKVELYRNTSIYEVEKKVVKNAEVVLFENGLELDKLNLEYNVNENPYFEIEGGTQFDTTYYYTSNKAIAKQNCTYKIIASAPGFDAVSAQTTIPHPLPIIKIDTSSVYELFHDTVALDGQESLSLNFALYINDEVNFKNYYRLIMYIDNGSLKTDTIDGEPVEYIRITNGGQTSFDTKSPILTAQNEDANSNIIGAPQNQYRLFNDELLDGKQYPVEITKLFSKKWHGRRVETQYKMQKGEFYHFTFYLHSISEATYLYFKSFDMQYFYTDFPFIEPVTVYSNIDNGAGVFGSYSASKFEICFGEYPIEGVEYR